METIEWIALVFITSMVGIICFTQGVASSYANQHIALSTYQTIIKPALQDCTHPDYYYQDSHRELCDGLGVNATK